MPCDIKSLITKEFLEQVFNKPVEDFTYCIGTKSGDNYLSCLYAVQVKVKDTDENSSETKNLFLKCYPDDPSTCEFLESVSIFTTEYWIYDQFIPRLNDLAREISIDSQLHNEALINVVQFYGGNVVHSKGDKLTTFDNEPWTKENFIILEDLRPKGYQMLDRTKGLDLPHCLLTINQLANIHALSWVYKRRNNLDKLVDKHPYLHDAMNKKENEAGWRPIVEGFNSAALKVIQEKFGEDADISIKLQDFLSLNVCEIERSFLSCEGVNEVEAEALLRIKSEEPIPSMEPWTVATHGDCWINNLLFKFSDETQQSPLDVVLIDQQCFREACLTADLAYFIYSSIKPAMRKQFTPILLKTYFDKFVKICEALGENPPLDFTYEIFLRRWRRARVFAFLMSIQFVAFMHKPSLLYNASFDGDVDEMKKREKVGESSNPVEDAYPGLDKQEKEDDEWKNIIIDTMLEEYNDGIF